MSELRQKTIRGVGWSIISLVGRQGGTFIVTIILVRLLSPQEFGLLAMVTVLTSFANIFGELGFSAALVHKQDVQPVHLSSVFWLNLGIGLLLTLVFVGLAPLIAGFYQEPILVPLTMFLSLNFVIGSFNIVQNTLLTKALDFHILSKVEISAVIISGIIAILMAYTGFGVWSLATQSVVATFVTAVLLWSLGNWRPSFVFNWSAIQELLGFSMSLFGSKLLNYWVRNLDYLLIGRLLGTGPLGIYTRAYELMLMPLTTVSRVISRVMFPALSQIQGEKERVKRAYLQVTRIIALITFPMMLGLLVTAEPFVLTLFGPRWAEMIPLVQIFSVVGMLQSIGTLNGNLYLSQGRADLQFKVGLVVHIVPLLGIIIGLRWGILGVAIGYAIGSFLIWYPTFYFAASLINLKLGEHLYNLSPPFICVVLMATVVWAMGMLLPHILSSWILLIVQVLCGALIYISLIHLLKIRAYLEVRTLLVAQWKGQESRLIGAGEYKATSPNRY